MSYNLYCATAIPENSVSKSKLVPIIYVKDKIVEFIAWQW